MFTGIIKQLGTISSIRKEQDHLFITVTAPNFFASSQQGDSIAIDGICLTVLSYTEDTAEFDVAVETQQKTGILRKEIGNTVNIEKPMTPSALFDGHMVQGHVDGTAVVVSVICDQGDWWLTLDIQDSSLMKYVVEKGSIAVNGVSLTVVTCVDTTVRIMMLDHTKTHTNLGTLVSGDIVHIETDVFAKYIEKMMKPYV